MAGVVFTIIMKIIKFSCCEGMPFHVWVTEDSLSTLPVKVQGKKRRSRNINGVDK